MESNFSAPHLQFNSIEDVLDLSNIRAKENLNILVRAPVSSSQRSAVVFNNKNIERKKVIPKSNVKTNVSNKQIYKRNQFQNSINLKRTLPKTDAQSNIGASQMGTYDKISKKKYKLLPKISPGKFDSVPNKPLIDRSNQIKQDLNKQKSSFSNKVKESFARYIR